MKKLLIVWGLLFLTSCFSEKPPVEETPSNVASQEQALSSSGETLSTSWEIIVLPPHEKSTSVEAEFSEDLNDLLKLIDEPTENE